MKVFVGTAEEYTKVAHLFTEVKADESPSSHPAGDTEAAPGRSETGKDDQELTPDLLELAFGRISLSDNQRAVLNAVVEASPGWINTKELAKATNLARQQIAGVWGALGRRFASTKGWPKGKWPIIDEWDAQKHLWRYQASPMLVQLVRDGRITLELVKRRLPETAFRPPEQL